MSPIYPVRYQPGSYVYSVTRIFLNLLRSLIELIYALILTSVVGLGPCSGVLAIAQHATVMLAKFVAKEIEHVNLGLIEAFGYYLIAATIVMIIFLITLSDWISSQLRK